MVCVWNVETVTASKLTTLFQWPTENGHTTWKPTGRPPTRAAIMVDRVDIMVDDISALAEEWGVLPE